MDIDLTRLSELLDHMQATVPSAAHAVTEPSAVHTGLLAWMACNGISLKYQPFADEIAAEVRETTTNTFLTVVTGETPGSVAREVFRQVFIEGLKGAAPRTLTPVQELSPLAQLQRVIPS